MLRGTYGGYIDFGGLSSESQARSSQERGSTGLHLEYVRTAGVISRFCLCHARIIQGYQECSDDEVLMLPP